MNSKFNKIVKTFINVIFHLINTVIKKHGKTLFFFCSVSFNCKMSALANFFCTLV